jgi:hypothetical protein
MLCIPELSPWRVWLIVPIVCGGLVGLVRGVLEMAAGNSAGIAGAFMGLLLAGGGSACIWGARRYDSRIHRINQLARSQPDEAWKSRPEWASGEMRPVFSALTPGLWIMAVILNGAAWRLALSARAGEPAAAGPGVWLLPAMGIALAAGAVVRTAIRHRLRRSVLRLETLPATLGGNLEGTLDLRRELPSGGEVEVRLSCVGRTVDRGRNADRVLWQSDAQVHRDFSRLRPGWTTLGISIRIPRSCPESALNADLGGIIWRLEVAVRFATRFRLRFEVPVFEARKQPGGGS